MRKLSMMDNGFLQAESREAPFHVGGLQIFKLPKGAKRKEFYQKVMDNLGELAAVTPPFNQRLHVPPLNLGLPSWIEDKNFDLEYHLRHSALPHPGAMEQLKTLVSRLHGTLLERTRPLWEFHLIEGLEGGRFALYFKIHHAYIDGVGGMNMMKAVLSDSPDAQITPLGHGSGQDEDADSSQSKSRGGATSLSKIIPEIANAFFGMGRKALSLKSSDSALWYTAPRTILNGLIAGQRRVAIQSFSLEEFKQVGHALGTPLNDVVLSICAGALRRYLLDRDALPGRSLNACLPVSVRPKDDTGKSGNVFATMMCSLGTHIEDPLERIRFVNRSTSEGKKEYARMSEKSILGISMIAGAPLVAGQMLRIADKMPLAFNLIISNVPGSRKTLYVNGARMEAFYALSLLYNMQALTIVATSYVDSLDFCMVACRKTMPDLDKMMDYLIDEFDNLKQLSMPA